VTASYLALGDSYTIGEGVAPDDRWPVQLVRALRARGTPIDDPVIIAQTGWTTAELLAALEALPTDPGRDFALVSLLIGVNDQYRGLESTTSLANFDRLLSRAITHADGHGDHVLVASVPDWSATPFASRDRRRPEVIAREIDTFNRQLRLRALTWGARFIDVTASSRCAAGDPTLLATDGLHPSAAMYAEWAAIALPHAVAALVSSPG
jgi:lysophospholipase L1-like esterase